ncbi:hypothetical protein [Paracidovorax anthurii]|uniref:Lipoprotein n=1 Tax=Paracidovorax anthurii TaxID=78229 RepID=A0A328YBU1_9BURK|nr:hypothetical protein [Paracidovorax anthurii]RAR71409.1 hypothetical protein AX018_11005 [Paracidovorax anthurii]
MRRWGALLLLPCVFMVPGCALIDAREAGRAWQRHECLRQPSPDAQRRCEEVMKAQRRALGRPVAP